MAYKGLIPSPLAKRATSKSLKLSVIGNFSLCDSSGRRIELTNRRGNALLALLAIVPNHRLSREHISQLLWSGRFKKQARASLRQCLHDLSREFESLGLQLFETSNTHIALRMDIVSTDLQQLESILVESPIDEAISALNKLSGQRLLQDLKFGDRLDSWLKTQRLQIESMLRVILDRRIADLEMSDQTEKCDRMKAAWQRWAGSPVSTPKLRIAILPFEEIDDIGGDFHLASGAHDELSSRITGQTDIPIVGRTSVMAVADAGLTIPEIAEKLSVSHIIEGRIHRRPDQVSLSLSLVDGINGTQIWKEQLTAPEDEFFQSRSLIGSNIIAGFCKTLGIQTKPFSSRVMTSDPEAYSLYLQGRALTQRSMIPGSITKAIDLLEQSLEIDPDFSEAWTALAEAYIHSIVYTPCIDKVQRSEKAASYAKRALELDPSQGYAHAILSIHDWTRFNPSQSLENAMTAYRLEPNNADVSMRLGSCLLYLGRTRDALPYVEAAIQQDPVYARNYGMLSVAHLNLGNFDKALAAGQRMVDLNMPGLHLALVQAAMGHHETAVETYYDARRFIGTIIMSPHGSNEMSDEARDFYMMTAAKGICSGDPDARQTYCNLLDMLHLTLPEPYDPSIAWPAVWMGHSDLVMKLYRECIHPANMPGLMSLWADIDPLNRTIKHPDFMAFAADIGMVEAWEKYGWPDLIPSDPRT